MTRILLVEDEESYREPLTYQLIRDGFDVVAAEDGRAALVAFDKGGIDLVLLDLMLPGLPGTEVCRELRRRGPVPVIMLTAKDTEIDKVVGLELGADDYVTKPYSYRELVARVRAVLRRGAPAQDDIMPSTLSVGGIVMDVDQHLVSVRGVETPFTLKEFELLEMFLRNPDRVLTRGQLIDRVWGAGYVGDTKTLDVHVKRLRSKIEVSPGEPASLLTVRGLGYRLVDPRAD